MVQKAQQKEDVHLFLKFGYNKEELSNYIYFVQCTDYTALTAQYTGSKMLKIHGAGHVACNPMAEKSGVTWYKWVVKN